MYTVWFSKKWVLILLHSVAWIFLFSLPFLLHKPYEKPATENINHNPANFNWFFILSDLLWIALFYLNSFLLIPKLFNRKKYWLFSGLQITVLLIIMLLHNLFFYLLLGKPTFDLSIFFFYNLFPYLFILASSTSFQLIREKINTDKLTKEKENETLKTELSLLRSQVSPHFMFNVLNNMVALARKHSELLEPSLIKLSSLMRYMLYETDEKKVSLEKEIDYLQSYIDLQQQRFGKNLQVTVSMPQADQPYEIEPMLLIPFVENAFKHGTGMIEKPIIDIELVAEKNVLRFCVRNKFNPASEELKDNTAGIGLTNVQRRLDLIYGTNHSLMINKNDDQFIISLQIFLAR